ncbi:hypothetical protein E2C01_039607 [Portunus trituberculatus]|uniref:Uncharacterized protein n=1 Tax=Portunus trituberculatus TaxID=210409 RepID=A0A5B7FF61_PORTR|nr:hypothetical protein [Portunus trituberculatus]
MNEISDDGGGDGDGDGDGDDDGDDGDKGLDYRSALLSRLFRGFSSVSLVNKSISDQRVRTVHMVNFNIFNYQ